MMKTKSGFGKRGALATLSLLLGCSFACGLYYAVPKTAHAEKDAGSGAFDYTLSGTNNADIWNSAMAQAETDAVSIQLGATWQADGETGFGAGDGFDGGALLVKGCVTLDLNGYSLDRNLSAESETGWVIRVAENSKLVIRDSSAAKTGTLTGAYGINGGAIYAYSSSSARPIEIELDGITISGNKATVGAGMYLHANTNVYAKDVTIKDNAASARAGGMYLTGNGNDRANVTLAGKVVVKGNTMPVKVTVTEKNPETDKDVTKVEDKIGAGNIGFGSVYSLAVEKLETGSEIGVTPTASQKVIAIGYKAANLDESKIAVNPATYFFTDGDGARDGVSHFDNPEKYAYKGQNGYIALDSDGNVARSTVAIDWKVKKTDGGVSEEVDTYGISVPYGQEIWAVELNTNTIPLPGGKRINEVNRVDGEVAPYTLTYGIGGINVAFDVWVMPTVIEESEVNLAGADNLTYNGEAKTPSVTVTGLTQDTHYTVSYENNVAAGTAKAIVTGIGNYAGKVEKEFTINKAAAYKAIVWEYLNDGEWTETPAFSYNGKDQSASVRAKLEVEGVTDSVEYVYASADAANGMYLSVKKENTATAMTDAGTYTVALENTAAGNAAFGTDYDLDTTVEIKPQTVDFPEDLEAQAGLWQVGFNGTWSSLLDGEGLQYMVGNVIKNGDKNEKDTYAAWRDGTMTLRLNGSFMIGDIPLSVYLQSATTVTYANDSASAAENADPGKGIKTSVTLTLNGNFASADNEAVTLTLGKTWKIVTLTNEFKTLNDEDVPAASDWTYGSVLGVELVKPVRGKAVVYTFIKEGAEVGKFATVVEGNAVAYYQAMANGTVNLDRPINNNNYFVYFVERLGAGDYVMRAHVPATLGEEAAVPVITRDFTFTVKPFSLTDTEGELSEEIELTFLSDTVSYNGAANNLPEVTLTFHGRKLEQGKDFELTSENVNAGKASLTVTGIGGLAGELVLEDSFEILQAQNSWEKVPSIMNWTYRSFDKQVNKLTAAPRLLDNARDMWFKIATDTAGKNAVEGLEHFTLRDGVVDDQVAEKLASLPVGDYYLLARVEANYNYTALTPDGIAFRVFTAVNYWETAPSVSPWVTGSYDADENGVTGKSHFGAASLVITDEDGNVVYDSSKEINLLAEAGVGTYVLTATVAETDNYSGLSFTSTFRIFAKAGLPWWVTLVVVLGVLLIVTVVLIILQKKGVLQMLSGKMVVAIRAKASADATIAAVKANKVAEEAKAALALAEARERIEALRLASEEAKNRPASEQVEDLEERAQDAAKQAARMQKKAARIQKQADIMKAQATIGVEMEGQIPAMPKKEEVAAAEAPAEEKPAEVKPAETKPAAEKPTEKKTAKEKPETPEK